MHTQNYLTNLKFLLHFFPEILPLVAITLVLVLLLFACFSIEVIQILLKCFEQHKLKV